VDIINDTPFQFGYIAGRIPFPGHSLTLIVKATFDLVPDGEVVVSDDQQLPTGDEFYEEDEEMQGGPRYASDFAFYKPLADLCLVGHCHAPKDTVVPARRITFQVGESAHSLTVYGDRYWIGPVATDPEPFSKMPLRYDYSFGGKGFNKNPFGRGYVKTADTAGNTKRFLPNIMQTGEQMATPLSRLAPAGFGPIHREWPQRKSKLGSYRGKYLKKRWPWFAEDMDWRYFNAAPDELQTEFLRGDEALYFENLHLDHQDYRSTLAGMRARCFVNCEQPTDSDVGDQFLEVPMNLDTLWVDMDQEKVVLVWRGWTQVLSEEFEEVRHILIAAEPLTQQPEPIAHYDALLHRRLKVEEEEWEEEPPPPEPEPEIDDDTEKLIAEANASYRKAMIDVGLDPDNPPEPSEADKRREAQILKELGLDDVDEETVELTRESVAAQFEETRDISELDLSGMDLSGFDFSGGNLQAAVMKGANLSGATFDAADLTRAVLAEATLSEASFKKANLADADLSATDCTRADLSGANLTDAVFDAARMMQSKVAKADAKGTSFIETDLSGVILSDTDLSGADLSGSNLNQTNMTGANLAEASMEGAQGPGVVMDGADLTELRASGNSSFTGGSFKQVTAKESIWESSDLSGTDFSFSKMEGASFAEANLTSARLRAADMRNSRFEKADLSKADLVYANLLESSFEKARLTQCDFRNANLYGSEFLNATIDDTRFENANLNMTKLAES
jgi:uncharacterized protein YjbI with pentapeptide repeats